MVARSSSEIEFRTMIAGVCELLWIKIILRDLKVQWSKPMKLYCHNKSIINIAHNPIQHDQTKKIKIDIYFNKEKLDNGLICIPYSSTGYQFVK